MWNCLSGMGPYWRHLVKTRRSESSTPGTERSWDRATVIKEPKPARYLTTRCRRDIFILNNDDQWKITLMIVLPVFRTSTIVPVFSKRMMSFNKANCRQSKNASWKMFYFTRDKQEQNSIGSYQTFFLIRASMHALRQISRLKWSYKKSFAKRNLTNKDVKFVPTTQTNKTHDTVSRKKSIFSAACKYKCSSDIKVNNISNQCGKNITENNLVSWIKTSLTLETL